MPAVHDERNEPSAALTWAAIVVALGVALALVAAFGGPKNVRLTMDTAGFSLGCGPHRSATLPVGIVANTDDRAGNIISVTLSDGSTNVHVIDFAAMDAGVAFGPFRPERALSFGDARLPQVDHPRTVLPGRQSVVEALVTAGPGVVRPSGFDITVQSGPQTHVLHAEAGRHPVSPCSTAS